jgi:hypothetical protein
MRRRKLAKECGEDGEYRERRGRAQRIRGRVKESEDEGSE